MFAVASDPPGLVLAFVAGFVSFVSPCCLPLVPGYVAAISGPSGRGPSRRDALARGLVFTLTFSLIFIALGLTATALGAFLFEHQRTLNRVGGALIAALGVFCVAAVVVLPLNRAWRSSTLLERAGAGGPVTAGAAFAIAWTPCIGPTLGATLSLAATAAGTSQATLLLTAYSAGLAVPFLLVSAGSIEIGRHFGWFRRHAAGLQVAAGIVMVVMGVLVFTGELYRLNVEAQRILDALGLNFWQSI